MKLTPALLAGSLLANAVLCGFLLLKPAGPAVAPPAPTSVTKRPAATPGLDFSALQAALASGNAQALAAAGCPPDIGRALLLGRALDTFQSRARTLRPSGPVDGKYWTTPREPEPRQAAANQIEMSKAVREFSEALRAGVGVDLETIFGNADFRYSFLPTSRQEQLRRIERDYADMESQIRAEEAGFQLPSDRGKLNLLRSEKERDLAAMLTAEEREQYALRNSSSATAVRQQYGAAIQTEEQYQRVYTLQKAFDDRFGNQDAIPAGTTLAEWRQARGAAEQQLQKDIRATLPPEQWEGLQRTNDPDVRTTEALARRLNLPTTVSDSVVATRATYATQSLQINANAVLAPADRKALLATLATKAESDLQAVLGPVGTQAYLQRSSWVNLLKNGTAFSTNPADAPGAVPSIVGPRIYPVPAPQPDPAAPPRPRG